MRRVLLIVAMARAQQIGTQQAENHPPLTTYTCDATGACTPESSELTLDANWRWTNKVGTSTNCYTGDEWDTSICPDPVTCAKNCALEGADYAGTCAFGAATPEQARFSCAREGAADGASAL